MMPGDNRLNDGKKIAEPNQKYSYLHVIFIDVLAKCVLHRFTVEAKKGGMLQK